MRTGRVAFFVWTMCLLVLPVLVADTWFVDVNGVGGVGVSWATAFTNLQDAFSVAVSNDQIWVAEGTYYPTYDASRTVYFAGDDGIAIYGGFSNGMSSLEERDWGVHHSILSGDIGVKGDRTDNSYHVILGGHAQRLDGIWIVDGYASGTSAMGEGGGLYVNGRRDLVIVNCVFSNNAAFVTGGGIRFSSSSATVISNTVFDSNSSIPEPGNVPGGNGSNGGISGGTWTLVDCTFRNNSARYSGAFSTGGNVTIRNCCFIGNRSGGYYSTGGGSVAYFSSGTRSFEECRFVENDGHDYGCIRLTDGTTVFRDCVFTGNRDPEYQGGCIQVYGSADVTVETGVFAGNYGKNVGGGSAMSITGGATPIIKNCLFVGNWKRYYGGAVRVASGSPRFENCLFYGNSTYRGGGIWSESNVSVTNCVFWGNYASAGGKEIYHEGAARTHIGYSDLQEGWDGPRIYPDGGIKCVNGGGNMADSPLWNFSAEGTLTADGVYDPLTGRTVVTDSNTNWVPGELVGRFLKVTSYPRYVIVTNTATTITVWGDARYYHAPTAVANAVNGASYHVEDYHLKSKHGRYTRSGWVGDGISSPLIDAGYTNSPVAYEPFPNGDRINIGPYGGTVQASKSVPAPGTVVVIF